MGMSHGTWMCGTAMVLLFALGLLRRLLHATEPSNNATPVEMLRAMRAKQMDKFLSSAAQYEAYSALDTSYPGVQINGSKFVQYREDQFVDLDFLFGTNVVVKASPWLPSTNGSSPCKNDEMCRTWTRADIEHNKNITKGRFNFIRLSTIWTGVMQNETTPCPHFRARLESILALCNASGVYVLLDVHQDAFSDDVCGEGVPKYAFSFHAKWKGVIQRTNTETKWEGNSTRCIDFKAPNGSSRNTNNRCCAIANDNNVWSDNLLKPMGNVQTVLSLARFYAALTDNAALRDSFERSYILMIKSLAQMAAPFPNVLGIELFNEPEIVFPGSWWSLYAKTDTALHAAGLRTLLGIPDMQETNIPLLDARWQNLQRRLRRPSAAFYVYHDYSAIGGGQPLQDERFRTALKNLGSPSVMSEAPCIAKRYNDTLNVSNGFAAWHYHRYCNTPNRSGPFRFGFPVAEDEAFGACITGFGSADVNCLGTLIA